MSSSVYALAEPRRRVRCGVPPGLVYRYEAKRPLIGYDIAGTAGFLFTVRRATMCSTRGDMTEAGLTILTTVHADCSGILVKACNIDVEPGFAGYQNLPYTDCQIRCVDGMLPRRSCTAYPVRFCMEGVRPRGRLLQTKKITIVPAIFRGIGRVVRRRRCRNCDGSMVRVSSPERKFYVTSQCDYMMIKKSSLRIAGMHPLTGRIIAW